MTLDLDNLQELRKPFEPLPPIEQSTHTPIDIHEIFIKPNLENLMQNYDIQNNLSAIQSEESKLFLDNASPEDIPRLEQKLMSLPELTPEKNSHITKEQPVLEWHPRSHTLQHKWEILQRCHGHLTQKNV